MSKRKKPEPAVPAGQPLPCNGCRCKNSKCLKLYCECLQRLAYCNGCSCKNCHNTKEHDDKRQQAIERIKERNPNAFNKPVAGGTQRKCKCKRSQCLKKYCECFQAGLPCLPECVCVSCHNFEGSDMRTRALAGEELDLKPSRHRHDLDDEDRIDDDDEGEVLVDVKPRPRRATRRKVTAVYDEASDGGGAGEDDDEPAYAPGSPARGGGGGGLVVPSFGGLSFDAPPISRPGALPVRLPAGSTRSFRNQLVRLDLCSFISSSIHPFCNMLMLGTEANARASAKAEGTVKREVAVKAEDNEDKMDLRANEQIDDASAASLQEKFVLEESASFLTKVLKAAEASVESQKILLF